MFDNAVDPQWRADLFALIQATPNLDWLLLTKRIGSVASMVPKACGLIDPGVGSPSMWEQGVWPENVWLGATIVNQKEADRDIPKLLAIPAAKCFLSMEPLLGPVNLRGNLPGERALRWHRPMLEMLDWVIVGGESGPGARPMHPDWARDLRDQCAAAEVPFLFKQWGEWRPAQSVKEATCYPMIANNRLVAAPPGPARDYRPMSLCYHMPHQVESMIDGVGEFAYLNCAMFKPGKKIAGRLLDGKQHDGYPIISKGGAT